MDVQCVKKPACLRLLIVEEINHSPDIPQGMLAVTPLPFGLELIQKLMVEKVPDWF